MSPTPEGVREVERQSSPERLVDWGFGKATGLSKLAININKIGTTSSEDPFCSRAEDIICVKWRLLSGQSDRILGGGKRTKAKLSSSLQQWNL